jgi:hypothetical protein
VDGLHGSLAPVLLPRAVGLVPVRLLHRCRNWIAETASVGTRRDYRSPSSESLPRRSGLGEGASVPAGSFVFPYPAFTLRLNRVLSADAQNWNGFPRETKSIIQSTPDKSGGLNGSTQHLPKVLT